mmetsp:Transcript_13962/g.26700  ORF Transcript_13962/g.26700 Transcript_13962/m.26700 type:complete len:87 (-) Transcript_13962:266-526(-)
MGWITRLRARDGHFHVAELFLNKEEYKKAPTLAICQAGDKLNAVDKLSRAPPPSCRGIWSYEGVERFDAKRSSNTIQSFVSEHRWL